MEELALDRDEAKMLAEATAEVAQHYNVDVDPKTMAWIGLFGALGTVYGPRIAAISLRKKFDTAEKNDGEIRASEMTASGGKVVQMTALGFPSIPQTSH